MCTDRHIAKVFTQYASIGTDASELDIRMVQRILVRAELPPELLALAFSILCGLNRQSLPADVFPSDLLVVSALSLAVSYTNDKPPSFSHWSQHVCEGTWTAARIDKTSLQVFAALNWRLHNFSHPSALQTALSRLITPIATEFPSIRIHEPYTGTESGDFIISTHIFIDGTATWWANGQVTPEDTPPSSLPN